MWEGFRDFSQNETKDHINVQVWEYRQPAFPLVSDSLLLKQCEWVGDALSYLKGKVPLNENKVCWCLALSIVWLTFLLCIDVLRFIRLFQTLSVHQLTPQCRGLRAFTRLKQNISLCSSLTTIVTRKGWSLESPWKAGSEPRILARMRPSDTCGGLWMSQWWDWGMAPAMKTLWAYADRDTHRETKAQLPKKPDWHTTLDTNITELF